MSAMNEFHRQAMDFAARGFMAQMNEGLGNAIDLFAEALELELAAIAELEDPVEPTNSVLHRSAGWMAFHSRQFRRAEQLACTALAGEPPDAIADELRILLEHVNFHRHFEAEGIMLGEGEIQLSVLGKAVTEDIALLSDVMTRINHIQTFMYRIAQWKLDLPYRGRIPNDIKNSYRGFIRVPKARGFALSLRLGQPMPQAPLPQFLGTSEVVSEFIDLMELASTSDADTLSRYVNEPAYQRNFIGLAKNIAPDGSRISRVGFTSVNRGDTRSIAVTRPSSEFPAFDAPTTTNEGTQVVERTGILRYADASAGPSSNNRIKLVNDGGDDYQVIVPAGLMDDIVRPMWNSHVTVRGTLRGRQRNLRLTEIWESEPDSNRRVGQILTAIGAGGGFQQALFHPVC